ncbi:hypothetical protein H5410_014911 [Solanum commersonii]|uniref:Uncharacterized protein n=1 Tax=Solanum commersonii TaxID=4109 RepID=A0A9J5ZSV3_SOLCO|nr:hypothetical protein H5410_014911 [Solanum commersonii]
MEYYITESFSESPTTPLSRRLDFLRHSLAHWNIRRDHSQLATHLMSPNRGFINTLNLNFWLSSSKTQVQQFKKYVSNSATQDSIMNAHKKAHFTYTSIKCALKVSNSNSPLSKNLKLKILASNASPSLTKEIKCPHRKKDSIYTHNGSTI